LATKEAASGRMSSLNKIVAQSIGARSAVASRLPRVLYAVAMDPSAKFGSMEEQMVFLARAFQKEESLFLPLFESPGSQERPTPMEEAGVPIACLDMRRFRWHVLSELLSLIRHTRSTSSTGIFLRRSPTAICGGSRCCGQGSSTSSPTIRRTTSLCRVRRAGGRSSASACC